MKNYNQLPEPSAGPWVDVYAAIEPTTGEIRGLFTVTEIRKLASKHPKYKAAYQYRRSHQVLA